MKTKIRFPLVSAVLLALLLTAGCVSAPKEAETVPAAQTEADAGSSATTDAGSSATTDAGSSTTTDAGSSATTDAGSGATASN